MISKGGQGNAGASLSGADRQREHSGRKVAQLVEREGGDASVDAAKKIALGTLEESTGMADCQYNWSTKKMSDNVDDSKLEAVVG